MFSLAGDSVRIVGKYSRRTPHYQSISRTLSSLKTLARNLKSEPDKLAAGRLQARIADELWTFDEPFAREVFRSAFDTVSQAVADDLPKEQAGYVNRQALLKKCYAGLAHMTTRKPPHG